MPDTWQLEDLFGIFDVEALAGGGFRGESLPARLRSEEQPYGIVEGSQILGQALVAASRSESDRFVKSAHMIFARPVTHSGGAVELALEGLASGRSFSSLQVRALQGERSCAGGLFLLDTDAPDCLRHEPPLPEVCAPEDSIPYDMGVPGRELRLVEGADFAEADATGPPTLDVWVRYARAPKDPAIRQAVIAHLCGAFTIGTAMRPHAGYGQAQAHRTLSTGVLSLTLHYHAPCALDDWLLYSHDSLHTGRGLCDGKGRIFERSGRLIASFEQEALLRPLPTEVAASIKPREVL